MDQQEENKFTVPTVFFDRFYEFTGSDESSRGFIICYVTNKGDPVVYTRTPNTIVELGLRKSLEKYLSDKEDQEGDEDINY